MSAMGLISSALPLKADIGGARTLRTQKADEPVAQYNLGLVYANGQEVPHNIVAVSH